MTHSNFQQNIATQKMLSEFLKMLQIRQTIGISVSQIVFVIIDPGGHNQKCAEVQGWQSLGSEAMDQMGGELRIPSICMILT